MADAQAETAVAQALADPMSDRAALAAQLEERGRWAEDGELEGSPYLTLAVHLRILVERLNVSPNAPNASEAPQRVLRRIVQWLRNRLM